MSCGPAPGLPSSCGHLAYPAYLWEKYQAPARIVHLYSVWLRVGAPSSEGLLFK